MALRPIPVLAGFVVLAAVAIAPSANAQETREFDCGNVHTRGWLERFRAAVARGDLPDPALRPIPPIEPRNDSPLEAGASCLSHAQILPFEDTDELLLTDFSVERFKLLMADVANAVMAAHGDNFDFIGVWLNFEPHHTIGSAVYFAIENDVTGIGVNPAVGTETFNARPELGIGGENIEGMVIAWNINDDWHPGTGTEAAFTRIAMAHEYEHRFGVDLPPLLDGTPMQGSGPSCYAEGHWNFQLDAQGSCMGLSEWVGSDPAIPVKIGVQFNNDTGGLYSYTDLYLMGYVSPAEMDTGNSEFRSMLGSNCADQHFGPIRDIVAADIVESAGPRVPDWQDEDQHYRTGWVMVHLPGDPPDAAELDKALAIIEQQRIDFQVSTLGRGTMNPTLFDDCNCNSQPDEDDIAGGTSEDLDANGIPDECEAPCVDPVDGDLDGVGDSCDNCPIDANADQLDADDDGAGDLCDNCPASFNPDQSDADGDLFGDLCDNCPDGPNPLQGPAPFGQTLVFISKDVFGWQNNVSVGIVKGNLTTVADYGVDAFLEHGGAQAVEVFGDPLPGEGWTFLVRLGIGCEQPSWQTSLGAEPGRDLVLP